MKRVLAPLVTLMSLITPALAQAEGPKAAAFRCEFTSGPFTVFDGDKFLTEENTPFKFVIGSVNYEAGTAQIIGNVGASNAQLLEGRDTIHFLEITPVGYLNVTTVYSQSSSDNRYVAVYSRHVGFEGIAMLSQFYGLCEGLR